MDGLLVINKPAGITSHDVVDRVRRILGTRRVGHTGTLDPFATGVMVVLVGKATRLAQFLDKDEKEYEAVIRFGIETDTGDATGVRKSQCSLRSHEIADRLAKTNWPEVLASFTGEITQLPPMYSAKKIAGKKLYESARKGVEIDRQPVNVTISKLDLLERIGETDIRVRVACSAGTYVRTLAEDIGRNIGIGAHLTALTRTHSGRFDLEQSIGLDELGDLSQASSRMLPVSAAVAHLRAITLDEDRAAATTNGLSTRFATIEFTNREALRMLDGAGELLAVGFYDAGDSSIHPKVVIR
jgi:tRNA pseudouridine55 synthase